MANFYTGYVRLIETELSADSIVGEHTFNLDSFGARNNIIEYFHFVDGNDDQIDATAGTVVITISSGQDIFQTIENGSFNAVDARSETRQKPNGFGRAEKIKIAFSGVTGAVGFRTLVSQSVS
ncbi:MAG: hypothetical protein K0U41_02260 [Gammaproteobacteria bacterium]|nr:hypothetical protein [Gammaproteobacteria bacterium]